jgi:predicted esterase
MLPATALQPAERSMKLSSSTTSHPKSTEDLVISNPIAGSQIDNQSLTPQSADDPELAQAAAECEFSPPRVIPSRGTHTHSFIVLHGRGGDADMFMVQYLCAKLSATMKDGKTRMRMGGRFPGVRYIFPSARSLLLARSGEEQIHVPQWFDVWDSIDREAHKEIQHDGIRDTTAFLRRIVEIEARKIGCQNVILVGLSQGAAVSQQLLLGLECAVDLNLHPKSNDGESDGADGNANDSTPQALGGAVFMSGWLPLASDIAMAALPDEADEFDSRWRSPAEKGLCVGPEGAAQLAAEDPDLITRQYGAANFVREVAELDALTPDLQRSPGFVHTPVFIGHGTQDSTVPIHMGVRVRDLLVRLGMNVRWKTYYHGHWWKEPQEMNDIVKFLNTQCGVSMEDAESHST